jgi:FG-GAP repeat
MTGKRWIMRPILRRLVLASLLAAALAATGPARAQAQADLSDFNGDGWGDLAVGAPGEHAGGEPAAGAVNVIYGSSQGLANTGDQVFTQAGCLSGISQYPDSVGRAVAFGNFDGDAYDDLAIGAPGESISGRGQAGMVHVLYGSPAGLTCTGQQVFHQDSAGIADLAEPGDAFGNQLASGDFNGDGNDDLAVGADFEDVGADQSSGVVHVLNGSSGGLTVSGDQFWHQDLAGLADAADPYDFFGRALAAGNFGRSGHDDLAIGVPGEDAGSADGAGAVVVLHGSSSGLTDVLDHFWQQGMATDNGPVEGAPGTSEGFGSALAAADFGRDLFADLAIGVPGEPGGGAGAGAVAVLYGAVNGLNTVGDQLWRQGTNGIIGQAEQGDRFGSALAAGNFGGDPRADLAVGVPSEDLGSIFGIDAGGINILYGGNLGLVSAGNQFWAGVASPAGEREYFGSALAAADFGRTAQADLAVGAFGEQPAGINSGAVVAMYGTVSGLQTTGAQYWHQDSPGIEGTAEAGDAFGVEVAAG